MSINYDYIIAAVKNLYPNADSAELTCLDFGCGAGQVVDKGMRAGLNYHGADPYPESRSEHYEIAAEKNAVLKEHIHKIENDTLPFPDDHFDVVTSNVVFEHIADLSQPLAEIHRVLKPEGHFLALFPTRDTWWEGHVKLYFAHWLNPPSKTSHSFLKAAKSLGLGLKSEEPSPEAWANRYKHYLHEYCFYRPMKEVKSLWLNAFGKAPENKAYDYMIFRFSKSSKLRKLLPALKTPLGRFVLEQACRIRSGRVLLVKK